MDDHKNTCLVYDHGACDCGFDDDCMTDEQIDAELLDKEEAKE